MANLSASVACNMLNRGKDGCARITRSRGQLEHAKLAVFEVNAIGESSASVDGYSHLIEGSRLSYSQWSANVNRSGSQVRDTRGTPPFRWRTATVIQRRTVIAAGLGWMLDAFDVLLYSIVLATLMREFGMNKFTAGLLNSLTLIASAIGSFVFGMLADRTGRRRILSISILTYSVFTFLCGFSTSITTLAVFRFLLGLGMGGEWNAGATLVAETWPSYWRGRAMAIVQSSWAIGYALAAVIAGVLLSYTNWRWVFFVGVLPALVIVWIQRRVPEPEIWQRQRAEAKFSSISLRPLWSSILSRLIALLAMNTFGMFAWWGLFTWIPAYLALPLARGGRGFNSLDSTTFLLLLNLCGMFPGYLLFGVLADRFGRKRSVIGYLVLASLSVPVFAVATRPAIIFLFASITAFFGTGFFVGSGLLGSELFPTAIRAAALGVSYNTARGLSALAPLAIGAMGEHRGLSWGFAACGIAFACAALCAAWVPETQGTELDGTFTSLQPGLQ
jgi:MFS family permease